VERGGSALARADTDLRSTLVAPNERRYSDRLRDGREPVALRQGRRGSASRDAVAQQLRRHEQHLGVRQHQRDELFLADSPTNSTLGMEKVLINGHTAML
jgi:hypothetical protein